MGHSFRKSMALLHTWAGVILGSVLFAIFWMGSLSVFDREFDRWMQPQTRLAFSEGPPSLDDVVAPVLKSVAAASPQLLVRLPTERVAHLQLAYRDADGQFVTRAMDPRSGRFVDDQGSFSGTGFFFPFHFRLHLNWLGLGYWLVGLASMAMLVLLVSGVVIHKKVFSDFFLFRPKKQLQRAALDLHNLTGVLGLPFHFLITLSGLIIFMQVYFPFAHLGAFGVGPAASVAFQKEATGRYARPPSGTPGALMSLDALIAKAEHIWPGGTASLVRVWHPGDANGYVEVRRSYAQDVTMNLDQVYFDAGTGAVLHRFEASPIMGIQRFISGMHFIQFDHWGLRWLYFFAGLSGCVMIATGFLFWLESRRASHAKRGLAGVRIVEALTVGSVTGILCATAAYLVVNRMLPCDATFAGQSRAELEVWVFYCAWLSTWMHAMWRRADPISQPARKAWREQCWAIAVLALLAVVLNSVTTGDHLFRTLARGDWQVAGVDLMLLLCAAVSAWAARRVTRLSRSPNSARRPAGESRPAVKPSETSHA